MAKINKSRFIILGILSMKPATGYDIKKWVEETFSFFWDMGYGQIYPTLQALEKEGLVSCNIESQDTRPDRKVYSITPAGSGVLAEWLSTPVEEEKSRYEILVKLFFGDKIPILHNIKNIQEFREKKQKELEILENFVQELSTKEKRNSKMVFPYLTILMGQHVFKASIDWANEAEEILRNLEGNDNH